MKIAILGGGSIGTRHAKNLIALGIPLSDLTVYDQATEPRCSAEIPGIRVLDAKVAPANDWRLYDAGLICFPAAMHAVSIGYAIRARRPFLVEKPATLGLDELMAEEWRTDVPHLVGYNWRFHPDLQRPSALASVADSIVFECRTELCTWPGRNYGPAIFECSHEIDLALHWCGPAEVYSCRQDEGRAVALALVHASGQRSAIGIRLDWLSQQGRTVTLHTPFQTLDGLTLTFDAPADHPSVAKSYVIEMKHFLAVARGEERSRNTLAEARRVVDICEQATRMAVAA